MADWSALTDDAEIAALLDFEPVVRRAVRHDGWSDDRQRGYILGLALTGNVDRAAQSVDRTQSGAWTVRNSAGAGGFGAAWDAALDLYHRRNPRRPLGPPAEPRRPRPAHEVRAAEARPGRGEIDPAEAEAMLDQILDRYLVKLHGEREARLSGRIVEADFYVRQLTAIEIMLELGGKAQQLIERWKRGDVEWVRIVATPATVLLERLRRSYWQEKGEADRPPAPALGRHDGATAIGDPLHSEYYSARDGDDAEWRRREAAKATHAAEAQAAWEERARREAAGQPSDRPLAKAEAEEEEEASSNGGPPSADPEPKP